MCVESGTSGLLRSQTQGVNIFVSTLLKSIYIQLDNCPFWSPLASGCTQHLTAFATPTESPCHNSSPMAVLLVFSSIQDPFGNGGPYRDHLRQCDCFLVHTMLPIDWPSFTSPCAPVDPHMPNTAESPSSSSAWLRAEHMTKTGPSE